MSVSGIALSTDHGLAIIAAVVGLGFLLLGRRSAPLPVLTSIAVVVALSGLLAGVRLIDLQPTYAELSDSESTAPQTVRDQADEPEPASDTEHVGPAAAAPDDTRGGTSDKSSDDTHDTGDTDQGQAPDKQSPDADPADSGGEPTDSSSPAAELTASTPAQPEPQPVEESPDADPAP